MLLLSHSQLPRSYAPPALGSSPHTTLRESVVSIISMVLISEYREMWDPSTGHLVMTMVMVSMTLVDIPSTVSVVDWQ